jgi:hypothetical protein
VGVVTFLEASFLETPFDRRHDSLLLVVTAAGGDEFVAGQVEKGVAYLAMNMMPALLLVVGGSSCGCRSVARNILRRLVLLGNLQHGAGQC